MKGTTEIYQLSDGRCMRRDGKRTVPATFRQISAQRQEIRSREYDRELVDGAVVTDLDLALVQATANDYLPGLGVEKYLQQMNLAEYFVGGLRLRRAALLLFAKNVSRWHPRAQIRILTVVGTELKSGTAYNVRSDETTEGNILFLLNQGWGQLRPLLASKTDFSVEARFAQRYIYPEFAVREALTNAIAHRDYSIQNGIEVFVFTDRLEIRSPGALLSTLTVQDLIDRQNAHESRNTFIARVLSESNYMRELGEGIKRMFELTADADQPQPRFVSNGVSFTVTFFSNSAKLTSDESAMSG